MAADCGVLGLRGMERQRGLTARLAAAVQDQRHPSSLAHPLRDLLAPRRSHIASGEADGQEAQSLRHAPLVQRSGARLARTLTNSVIPQEAS